MTMLRATMMALARCFASIASAQPPADSGQRLLIRDVTVIPMDEPGAQQGRDVLIGDGRVLAISESGAGAQ